MFSSICLFFECKKNDKIDFYTSDLQQIPSDYEELFTTMKKGFIDGDKVDWNNLEKIVLEISKISKDSAIVEAITLLGNNHTHYRTSEGKLILGRFPKKKIDSTCLVQVLEENELTKIPNVAYIKINRHGFNKTISDKDYILNNLKIIAENANSKNWIIDLRLNSGGSNWIMLTSLLPFLNDGIVGYTSIEDGEIPWIKKDGSIFNGNNNLTNEIIGKSLNFKINPNKIFVLINHNTSSSGEATLISLKSLPNVKILGNKTNGAATMNAEHKLSNGDILVLTAGYMMDKDKKIYRNGINPDVEL